MIRGFYNGVSGIKTQSFGMDVWANNISNINNAGFRASTPEFKSIFYQSMVSAGNNPTTDQVGLGSVKQTTALKMTDGSYQNTDNKFDFAIHGDGFFGVKDRYGQTYYTRAGNFDVDSAGNLVDMSGNFVQGTIKPITPTTPSDRALSLYGKTSSGTSQAYTINDLSPLKLGSESSQQNIVLPNFLYQSVSPTTKVKISGNLDSTRKNETQIINITDPSFTSTIDVTKKTISLSGNVLNDPSVLNLSKSDTLVVRIEDGTGKFSEANAQVNDDGSWQINDYPITYMDTDSITTKTTLTTTQEVPNTQKLSTEIFTPNGKQILSVNFTKHIPQTKDTTTWDAIATITDKDGNVVDTQNGTLVFDSHAQLLSNTLQNVGGVALEFGSDTGTDVYNGLRSSATKADTQAKVDGYDEGILKSYELDSSSTIVAYMSNGNTFDVAKLALYHFQNDQGLSKIGDNLFTKTPNSGEPFFYKDKNGDVVYGAVVASRKLEMSNVDLGTALTEVIVTQKAYDASAKSITTSDEMLQTAIQMKK
ncbi:flagellar basal body rod protein FlgC [Campylobacter mucosalis]|uniref:flagellar hook-basal body complex protein n=2 Tax=Campylobacter mucosalis TaxID=202 RepID=UPI0004D53046|nr:flagellar hook-basal body complex protein [Campylobacter mucosalis]KEA45256.1 flagellar basal body rod protein FlgC [Campylobacter mucosalis]QKF63732.1 flagellar hook protein [Campylobacter mucosalis]